MPNKDNRDVQRVKDILKAIELINAFIENITIASFAKSDLIQSAVVRQLEIIGEASDKISVANKTAFNNVEWRSIKSFRNLLIHEYFKVDAGEVWATIQNDLPALKEQMEDMLKALSV